MRLHRLSSSLDAGIGARELEAGKVNRATSVPAFRQAAGRRRGLPVAIGPLFPSFTVNTARLNCLPTPHRCTNTPRTLYNTLQEPSPTLHRTAAPKTNLHRHHVVPRRRRLREQRHDRPKQADSLPLLLRMVSTQQVYGLKDTR